LNCINPVPEETHSILKVNPSLRILKNAEGTFIFEDPSEFEVIHWEGTKQLIYVVGTEAEEAWENDYLEISGPFVFTYITPRIFPGNYNIIIRVHSKDYDNAVIQLYLDGRRIGSNLNLKSSQGSNNFESYTLGSVDFLNYSSHEIKINTIIPGIMKLDMILFDP